MTQPSLDNLDGSRKQQMNIQIWAKAAFFECFLSNANVLVKIWSKKETLFSKNSLELSSPKRLVLENWFVFYWCEEEIKFKKYASLCKKFKYWLLSAYYWLSSFKIGNCLFKQSCNDTILIWRLNQVDNHLSIMFCY